MVEMSKFAQVIFKQKYQQGDEQWDDAAKRVAEAIMSPYFPELIDEMAGYISSRKFMPGGRYLYSAGRDLKQYNNCFLMRAEDSREGWATISHNATITLMAGGGVGVNYSDLRPSGAPIKGTGGYSSGPLALMEMVNEIGRHVMMGGSRRSALIALLSWDHDDVFDFIHMKDWSEDVRALKAKDFNFPARMDMTNISVTLDDEFFTAIVDVKHPKHKHATDLYSEIVISMVTKGEPGFTVDTGENAGENLRNPCGEITSSDSDDVCNLGSLNVAAIDSIEEFSRIVQVSTAFLLCGTMESKLPYEAVYATREKNRRLGLGLMGIYEWLAIRSRPYAPDIEFDQWLAEYEAISDIYAYHYAQRLGVSTPVKVRSIAPTGTIGILAETTTGIEPMFAPAYRRRYLKGKTWYVQYVVDATAKRLADKGIDPDKVDHAYNLGLRERLEVQQWVQGYVDHGISSTINLPSPDSQLLSAEEFGKTLMEYLPNLRGVTVYPNGAINGQPLEVCTYAEAIMFEGVEIEERGNTVSCREGTCGV